MKIKTNPEIILTIEDIEIAIKEYIDRNIPEKLDETSSKISFILKDTGVDDDDRSPYIPQYQLQSATVKLKFLA